MVRNGERTPRDRRRLACPASRCAANISRPVNAAPLRELKDPARRSESLATGWTGSPKLAPGSSGAEACVNFQGIGLTQAAPLNHLAP